MTDLVTDILEIVRKHEGERQMTTKQESLEVAAEEEADARRDDALTYGNSATDEVRTQVWLGLAAKVAAEAAALTDEIRADNDRADLELHRYSPHARRQVLEAMTYWLRIEGRQYMGDTVEFCDIIEVLARSLK